jgi:hypothetical protein
MSGDTYLLSQKVGREENFRNGCLHRDGHHYVVTHVTDIDEWKKRNCPESGKASDLEGAHIIPYTYARVEHSPYPYFNYHSDVK